MGREFVNYLNTMNNASGDNINALAESQVTNQYYNHIRVDRKLGKYIVDKIKNGAKETYIITGHAGDGKTSILIQVLKDLGLLNEGEALEVEALKEKEDIKLMYVKDMSELSETKQVDLLEKSLNAPQEDKASILISNTGPLIKSFVKLMGKDEEQKDNIENILLRQLDSNECQEIAIDGKRFYLINIARIENIGFVKEIVDNICEEELWEECKQCEKAEMCPIYFNRKCIINNKDRVIRFIEMYYRWLQENDKRITIRQMLAQISFAFTGNINCSDINKYYSNRYTKFNLNFANLFFGYRGIHKIDEANQIEAIRLLNELDLDDCSFEEDYEIFVKENFDYFSDLIKQEVKLVWTQYNRQINSNNEIESENIESKQHAIRKAIRRFFLIYGLSEDRSKEERLYNQLYGELFLEYVNSISKSVSRRQLKQISKVIYEALYIKNVGVPPMEKTDLYLTLTRHDEAYQNVLLLLAKANERDLEVKQIIRNVDVEDIDKSYILKLIINGKEEFKITLPLLLYFYSVVNGEINTEVNPALSHGLAELNAKLIKTFRNDKEDSILSLLVNTGKGAKEVEIEISEDEIFIEV